MTDKLMEYGMDALAAAMSCCVFFVLAGIGMLAEGPSACGDPISSVFFVYFISTPALAAFVGIRVMRWQMRRDAEVERLGATEQS